MANVLAEIGETFAKSVTTFSWFWSADEAECPKSLIK